MRLKISLHSGQSLDLPLDYNRLIQSAIYRSISPELAGFLHDRGYAYGKRSFKLFTFSRLLGRFQLDQQAGRIIFPEGARLVVSSPLYEFCTNLLSCFLGTGRMLIGSQEVEVDGVEVDNPRVRGEIAVLDLLSPVVLYSTFSRPDGSRYTCYFQPGESEFARLLGENLARKFTAFYGEDAPDPSSLKVEVLNQPRMNLVRYKDTVVKGYTCRLRLCGPRDLLQIGLDAGIGSKNSQGFGCVEMVKGVGSRAGGC